MNTRRNGSFANLAVKTKGKGKGKGDKPPVTGINSEESKEEAEPTKDTIRIDPW